MNERQMRQYVTKIKKTCVEQSIKELNDWLKDVKTVYSLERAIAKIIKELQEIRNSILRKYPGEGEKWV